MAYFGGFLGKITVPDVLDKSDKSSDTLIMDFWDRIDPLAEELNASTEARRKWRERGSVPGAWHLPLLRLARKQDVELTEEELLSTTSRGRAA